MSYTMTSLHPFAEDKSLFYKDSTYEIVSTIAYLIGVPQRIFENEHEPPQISKFYQLEQDKSARIIRNLCAIRTAIERNFRAINEKMRMEYKSILSVPEYIPSAWLQQLSLDGIFLFRKSNVRLAQRIVEINRIITDRINNCKHLFPLWLNWQYIRELFLMPDGLTEAGTKDASDLYYANLSYYPYQVYINWVPFYYGNILKNDKKFVTLLYQWHEDAFMEYNRVSDAGGKVKNNIYDYINDSNRIVVMVDCENSDPYRLCATIQTLDQETLGKISKLILFDDVHTVDAWRTLESYTKIPVEHVMIERVKQNKSLVDIRLTTRVCHEFYQNNVDSFIIVSSDSDYWGLISSLPEARFLVMVEHEKCGPDMKAALVDANIFYCYIDDFYSGNSDELKRDALFREIQQRLARAVKLNVWSILEDAARVTRIEMTETEKHQFYEKHLKQMSLEIDADGNLSLHPKKK